MRRARSREATARACDGSATRRTRVEAAASKEPEQEHGSQSASASESAAAETPESVSEVVPSSPVSPSSLFLRSPSLVLMGGKEEESSASSEPAAPPQALHPQGEAASASS